MRSSHLDPLFSSLVGLSGVGPQTAKMLDRLLDRPGGGARVLDLLLHMPSGAIDRRNRPKIADAAFDTVVTLEVRVTEHRMPPPRSRVPARILVEDETGDVQLVFFLANHAWVERALPLGATRWVSGKLELWDGHRQMVHPTHVLDAEGLARLPPVESTYPLTEGLSPKVLAKAIDGALARLPDLPDWLPPRLPLALPPFAEALRAAHRPAEPSDVGPDTAARKRLAFDELLANQLALLLMRREMRRLPGRVHRGDAGRAKTVLDALPFTLTGAQTIALDEIRADLAAPARMLRLLQGDVGSGKTIVALLAMADVVAAGHQAALMAPTEILARQHHQTLERFGAPAGLRVALLTGRDTAATRRGTLEGLAAGTIDILVGTHALFQEPVAFKDLAFAVVDEQHKFGVHQRLALGAKGEAVDMLVMTATPIPRTLVLTFFGDMDVSVLRDKPVGRQPIETAAVSTERIGAVVARLQAALEKGVRAYWLCPLVEESETSDLAAAEDRADDLRRTFGEASVGLVHGRLKARDKDAAMAAFKAGDTRLLVATTVVEVGVDVPEATIMVIEHAERFGLAQLHQLRGRVGRGAEKSYCVLLYKGPLGAVAKARLDILRESEDGFRIAEEDLRLRGEGEVLGTRQSGLPGFRLADLAVHAGLLPLARQAAEKMLETNPHFEGEHGAAVRLLLHLFGRDEAIKLLRAG